MPRSYQEFRIARQATASLEICPTALFFRHASSKTRRRDCSMRPRLTRHARFSPAPWLNGLCFNRRFGVVAPANQNRSHSREMARVADGYSVPCRDCGGRKGLRRSTQIFGTVRRRRAVWLWGRCGIESSSFLKLVKVLKYHGAVDIRLQGP